MPHLLIADDELALRTVLARGFRRAGFTVSEAANGEEAIAQFERNPDIELVLLDVSMPKKDGIAVFDHIRACSTGVRVLCMTGYAEHATEVSERLSVNEVAIVAKPFELKELVARVRSMVDARQSTAPTAPRSPSSKP